MPTRRTQNVGAVLQVDKLMVLWVCLVETVSSLCTVNVIMTPCVTVLASTITAVSDQHSMSTLTANGGQILEIILMCCRRTTSGQPSAGCIFLALLTFKKAVSRNQGTWKQQMSEQTWENHSKQQARLACKHQLMPRVACHVLHYAASQKVNLQPFVLLDN